MLISCIDKEGPIHDVEWSPNSREFGVVYGYMPAKTTVFNSRAQMVKSLELGPRNTILFSPHGRLMLVAGFGNLQGQMDIYDVDMNYKKLCMIEASNSSVCEWSPDGKYILTATTSPRLRVDNGVKLWYFTGELIYHQEIDELYNVSQIFPFLLTPSFANMFQRCTGDRSPSNSIPLEPCFPRHRLRTPLL